MLQGYIVLQAQNYQMTYEDRYMQFHCDTFPLLANYLNSIGSHFCNAMPITNSNSYGPVKVVVTNGQRGHEISMQMEKAIALNTPAGFEEP